jgi:hypothetical protein
VLGGSSRRASLQAKAALATESRWRLSLLVPGERLDCSPGAAGGAGEDRRTGDRDDLLRWRPRGLRPAPERGVRADRRTRHADDLRHLRLRDRARPRRLRLRLCGPARSRAGQRSVEWTLAHTDKRSKAFMRELPFDLLSRSAPPRCTSYTARRARSTSTCSRTSRPPSTSAWPPPRRPARGCSGTRTSRGCASRQGVVRQLRLGRQAEGRRRSRRLRGARRPLRELEVTIERVAYDADAVAAEVRAAGLPGEYADRLLIAP